MFALGARKSGARHTPMLLLPFKIRSLYDSKQGGMTVSPVMRKVFTLISVLCRPVPAGLISAALCLASFLLFLVVTKK